MLLYVSFMYKCSFLYKLLSQTDRTLNNFFPEEMLNPVQAVRIRVYVEGCNGTAIPELHGFFLS